MWKVSATTVFQWWSRDVKIGHIPFAEQWGLEMGHPLSAQNGVVSAQGVWNGVRGRMILEDHTRQQEKSNSHFSCLTASFAILEITKINSLYSAGLAPSYREGGSKEGVSCCLLDLANTNFSILTHLMGILCSSARSKTEENCEEPHHVQTFLHFQWCMNDFYDKLQIIFMLRFNILNIKETTNAARTMNNNGKNVGGARWKSLQYENCFRSKSSNIDAFVQIFQINWIFFKFNSKLGWQLIQFKNSTCKKKVGDNIYIMSPALLFLKSVHFKIFCQKNLTHLTKSRPVTKIWCTDFARVMQHSSSRRIDQIALFSSQITSYLKRCPIIGHLALYFTLTVMDVFKILSC